MNRNVMNNRDAFQNDIMELYYGEANLSLKQISERYQVSLEECQVELQNILYVSKAFRSLPQEQVPQFVLNKLEAVAREQAEVSASKGFWQVWRKPVWGFASVLTVGVLSWQVWQMDPSKNGAVVAEAPVILTETPVRTVKDRLFRTSLDRSQRFRQPNRPYFNSLVSNVSLGNQSQTTFLDDELEQKMLNLSMSAQDVETLYFRARKLEKQGYYDQALKDYQFISKNYPGFEFGQELPLAMARCFENLGQKGQALSLLLAYEKAYGSSSDIQFWKDQLKSETF